MQLTSTGESRVNGYLFVLERSLKTFLPSDVVRDAVREIESHLHERIAHEPAQPDERAAVERILGELGPPLRVAQAYSAERVIEEAVVTGKIGSVLSALWRVTSRTMVGFWVALGVSVGYTVGGTLLFLAVMKPIFPENVGFWADNASSIPHDLGMRFPAPTRHHDVIGYWLIPLCLALGILVLRATHGCARRFLARWRERRALAQMPGFVA
jgi:hypothetical protein